METLKQLRQKYEAAKAKVKALNAEAGANLFSAEQQTAFDAAVAERDGFAARIAQVEAEQEHDRTTNAVAASAGKDRKEDQPWASLGEQMLAIRNYRISGNTSNDPRILAALGQNETIDTDGGFQVQPEFSKNLLTRTFENGLVTGRCSTTPMSSSRLVINGISDDNRVGGYAGAGIAVYRAAEAGLFTASKLKFRRVEFNANKLLGLFYATDELLEDAPALQKQVTDYFPLAFAWQLDNEALNGTGRGQFLGVLNSGATVTVTKAGGSATGTFSTANALAMVNQFWMRGRKNGVWFVGPDVEAVLYTLTIPGPQGTAVALYTPPGVGGNASQYGMMLGMPVIPIEQTAALGSLGDIILADMSQYTIGERSGVQFASSIHVAFLTDEQAFRWTLRNDGQPLWDKPVTQNNSANKVSPFVVLSATSR